MIDNVRQAVFQDRLALHAGGNSSDKMAAEVSTVARICVRMMLCHWMSPCSRARADRIPTSLRSVSILIRLVTSELIVKRSHGVHLHVCQAPNAFTCQALPLPNTKCVHMCVTKCVCMCVTKCVC